jgi:hypothetical protein
MESGTLVRVRESRLHLRDPSVCPLCGHAAERHAPGTFRWPLRNRIASAILLGLGSVLAVVAARAGALLPAAFLAVAVSYAAACIWAVCTIPRRAAPFDCPECPPPPPLIDPSRPYCFNPAARRTVPGAN